MPPHRVRGVKNPCKGCAYWCGGPTTTKTCDYILIEGKRRPCPPGEGCTVKKREKRKPLSPFAVRTKRRRAR